MLKASRRITHINRLSAADDSLEYFLRMANVLGERGIALEPGHLVMTGALHAAVPMAVGDVFRADFDRYLASPRPHLSEQAKLVGSYLVGAKRGDYDTPPPLRPLFRTIDLVVKGSLPARIRGQ